MRTLLFALICSVFAGPLHGKETQFRLAAKDRSTAETEVTKQATSFCEKDGKQLKIISMGVAEGSLKPKEQLLETFMGDNIATDVFEGEPSGNLSEIGELDIGPGKTTEENLKGGSRKVFTNFGDVTRAAGPLGRDDSNHKGLGSLGKGLHKKTKEISAPTHTAVISFQCE